MAIQIIRNEDANAINFSGSSFPSYYNSSLSASLSQGSTTEIDVNNVISGGKEFYKIPFTDFVDATGSAFANATECIDYINTQANIPRADLLRDSSRFTQGYYGLLTDYFFAGSATQRVIGGVDVNEWVEVGFDVASAGTFDNRPVAMKEAEITGSVDSEDSHTYSTNIIVGGNTSATVTVSTNTLTFTTGSGFGLTFEGGFNSGDNDGYGDLSLDFSTIDYLLVNPNDATDRAKVTNYTSVVDGDRTVTFDKDISAYLATADDTTFNVITDVRNVVTFKLEGLETTAFATFEGNFGFTPNEDEGQVEARLLFTTRPGQSPSTFDKSTLAGTMTQGAGTEYVMQPVLTFFVGDTIDTESGEAGTFKFQIRSSVPGTLDMRQLTAYINT
jgi:hypothetical protein